jgi:peptidoglycan/xylan/chitin deacetylase (PgdA/CDA1 family)
VVRTENFEPPYESVAIVQRPRLRWPEDARIALLITPSIEVWDLGVQLPYNGPTMTPIVLPKGAPDFVNAGYREYGLRIGIWRLMEVLDRHGVKVSAELNPGIKHSYPIVVEEGKKRGWEFIAHSYYQSDVLPVRFHNDKEGERAQIRKTVAAFRELVGKNPEGWLSPHLSYTPHTLELLAEEGFRFFCDVMNDDQPYPIRAGQKTLIGIPNTGLGDIGIFARQGKSPAEFVEAVKTCFDVLYDEGAKQGRIMNINFHPYISGTPHNIRAIDQALDYVLRHKGVWNCTRAEIVDWYVENYLQR